MSLDGRIAAVRVLSPVRCSICNMAGTDPESSLDECPSCHGATVSNPHVRLYLEPRETRLAAGQKVLRIANPPHTDIAQWSTLIGLELRGSLSMVFVGRQVKPWAKRISSTVIELIEQT